MDVAEFDKFADEYHNLHQENIRITGEKPEYFAEYKIRDLRRVVNSFGVNSENILDFGMGIGNSTPFLSEYFPDANLHGVDVSEKSLAIASERYECLGDFLVFDGKTTTYSDETFNVVFSAGVFHHVPFSEHFDLVCEVSRTLKNGGIFMIYEHNPFNPLTCHAVNTCPFDEDAVLLKPIRLRQLFQEAGMEFLLQEYRVFFPSFLALLRPIEKNLAWLPFGGQYFVVGKKT